jgi:hypothetical protein
VIEKQEVLAAKCGACDHVDYAPVGYEELLSGFEVTVVHQDFKEAGYACKTVHVGRVARSLAEKLHAELKPEKEESESTDDKTDDDAGLLAS